MPLIQLIMIENIRHWAYPDYTRLVLDLNRPVKYREIRDRDLPAVKLVLPNTRFGKKAKAHLASLNKGLLRQVQFKSEKNDVQVTISLKGPIGTPRVAPLTSPDRLVIDLPRKMTTASVLPSPITIQTIVIDPGHGGKDPGAIGKGGLSEKEVVLDIGLRLRKLIKKQLGKTVIMTRESDTYISLNDRSLLANRKNADMFISIHTNAHPKRSMGGIEIYILGKSSDPRALAVAARENSLSIDSAGNLDKTLLQILFDLDQDYKIGQSLEFAHSARRSFMTTLGEKYRYPVVDLRIKQAPFYVLLRSNMPSVLAEVSYISNPAEERLLRRDRYRQALAETLYNGLKHYIASVESTS